MSDYKSRIEKLCKTHNISRRKLEIDLGFGNGTIRRWDVSEPRAEKLQAVADYFGVSIKSLMGDDSEPEVRLDEFQYALYNETQKLTEEQKKLLLDLAKSMTKE